MKHLTLALAILFALALVSPAFGAPEESVEVRVTPTLVSVSLSLSSVDLGTVALGQEEEASQVPVATNNGSVVIDLDMKGTDATCAGSNVWTLSNSGNGSDTFMLKISKDSDWEHGVINLSSTAYTDFLEGLSRGAGQGFHVQITMPTSTGDYSEHTARIYVLATESS